MFKTLKSLKARMTFVSLTLVVVVMIVLAVTMGVYTDSFYYDKVYDELENISESYYTLADTSVSFSKATAEAVSSFEQKDLCELQFLDKNGELICSSLGTVTVGQMPDYDQALQNGVSGRGEFTSLSNQRVIAVCTLLKDRGEIVGAVRAISTTAKITRQVTLVVLLIIAIALLVIFFSYLFSTYNARSIIRPIKDISDAANKISKGDFGDRISPSSLTEMAELVNNINSMAEELESSEKMKNEFISSVSHELRTPLTAIKGWGETVRMAKDSDSRLVDKGIEIIIGETERLSGLVEELLDFSRLQSGRMNYKDEKIDIIAELSEVVYMYLKPAAEKRVELTYNEPFSISTVRGDSAKIKQVFINIIDNAIKYNRRGGVVLVEAEQGDSFMKITVADTGIGIKKEDVSKVKEKFFRSASNSGIHGNGIGLALADEIIKHHGGTLDVKSEENVGTTITIILPTVDFYDGI